MYDSEDFGTWTGYEYVATSTPEELFAMEVLAFVYVVHGHIYKSTSQIQETFLDLNNMWIADIYTVNLKLMKKWRVFINLKYLITPIQVVTFM